MTFRNIGFNRLTQLPAGIFSNQSALTWLYVVPSVKSTVFLWTYSLSYPLIMLMRIMPILFEYICNLQTVCCRSLQSNQIWHIPTALFSPLTQLRVLFANNSFVSIVFHNHINCVQAAAWKPNSIPRL